MKENENLKNQAIKAQQEQQRQQQQAADARAREEKTRQEDERRREEERRKTTQQTTQRETQKTYKETQVDIDYRYVMDLLKRENERFDASRRSDPAKQEQKQEKVQDKESPAMQRYKAHEKAMAPKVEEYIRQTQSRAQDQEKAPGRDR